MNGYDASRTAPADRGHPSGHGHGAGSHLQQQQPQYHTQWGGHPEGHGNGYVDEENQYTGYGSSQGQGLNLAPSSRLYTQPQRHYAGNWEDPRQQQQYQQPRHIGGEQWSESNYAPSSSSGLSEGSSRAQRSAAGTSASNTSNISSHSAGQRQDLFAHYDLSLPSTSARQSNRPEHRLPSLPALTTSSNAPVSGFFQQLEGEIDHIQAKHTPISSPVSANLTPSTAGRSLDYSNASVQTGPRRLDSGSTVREDNYTDADPNAYGGSGIISMYDPRVPSPVLESGSQMSSQSPYLQHAPTSNLNLYGSYNQDGKSYGPQSASQSALSYASAPSSQPETARQRRPPGSGSLLPRSASGAGLHYTPSMSAPWSPPVDSTQPLPASYMSSSRAGPSNGSMRSGRPSQDSNISCFSSNSRAPMSGSTSTSSGIVAPRPSMSSSIASRPSMNFSESSQSRVRPLPIPSSSAQNSGSSAQASAYMASPDIYESLPSIRERARSEFSRQSDFTQDFYASGEAIPANTSSRPPPSGRHPAADRYRITSTQQLEEHQYASTNRIHTAVPATSPSVRSVSEMSVNSTLHGFSPTLSHHTPTHPPPILHSHSEPVASHAISSTSSASRMQQNSNHALHTSTPRTPNSFASRSASFSTSAARERAEFARRNVSMGHGTVSRQAAGRPNVLSEPSPPLPSSPSISISTSYPDTSMSSTYSALSSAPSNSTYTSAMRKQASMSPSNMSLSAQGFLSFKKRHDSERERRRIEGLGLQHLNPALLSNLAVAFKDRIPRTLNVKGSVHYPSSFTGEQAVSCLAEILPFPYTDDRRIAVVIARNLHRNMFFNEVDWDDTRQLRDSHEQVYCFQDDEEQATIDYLNGNVAGAGVYSPSARAHEAPNQAQEVPNGVITRFTKCYSPFCGMEGTSGSGACYSLYCPNGKNPLGLQRKKSSLSLASSATEDQGFAEAWASTAPADLIERLGPKEVARQNVIFEIVTGEQAYKKDLDMLETAYAEPLRSADPPIIEPRRLLQFANQVFANLDELRSHSTRLINAFQIRQREQNPVVESIGDLVLDAALEWGQAYMDFAEAQVTGEYLVHEEKSSNSAFATFLQSRREAFGIKQDFRHYHLRPTIRLQRYLLPLAEYVKRCPEGHPDIETTQEAMRIIRQQCDACNSAVAAAQLRLACMQYDKLIERDFNYANDLDLLHPTRQLFHHGKMYAKPEGARSEWTEYQIMLFDNYLVIAKPRRTAEGYRLLRKPVRLDMLNVSGWDDPPMIRSSGFHLSSVIRAGDRRDGSSNHSTSDRTESKMWPIAFRIYGRLSGTLTLFVETSKNDKDGQARREWKTKVEQAAAARKTIMDAAQVFDLKLLMDPDLRKPSSTASLGVTSLGKILTSCPFTGPTGQRLVAVGTSTGLYIALKRDPTSLRQILQISTQYCAILQDFGMFLVHTEGRLLSYLLETLVQTSSAEGKGQQGPQQVSGQKDILFFKVGRVGARTLVVYAKKDGVNSTVLKAMEPVANAERSRVQHSRFLGMGGKKTEWFRLFKDAAVPTEVYNLTFTRSKLALVCAPGFEILDIDTLKTGSFPDWASIKADPSKFDASMAMLQRRCYESRAIGLFRISDSEFLFCYEDFAFFADRHGDPVRARFRDMIEWEGRPDTVVYCAPYILAFDSRFIEVRDVSRRGKLVQIIRGSNIRCTYDGQGLPSSEMEIRMGGSVHFEERVPHIVMRENNVDRLYELVPRTA